MAIRYEFDSKPDRGKTQLIADGIHWLRMPLPFGIDHINLWLIENDAGWVVVDTGIHSKVSMGIWRDTISGMMQDRPISHVVVTHLHPDHVGCAGWLTDEFGVDLWMTRDEYLLCRVLVADTGRPAPEEGVGFYQAAGFSPEAISHYQERFGSFGKVVAPLPEAYKRLEDGDRYTFAGHTWQVIVGSGHSPEHACFFDAERNLFISGDQILPTISSNVSVHPTEPHANPLGDWLRSLRKLKQALPDDVLVLPAHGKPFRGAHQRLDALIDEHLESLDKLLALCDEPRRAIDTFATLFKSKISDRNRIMATGEAIAHLNYLIEDGQVRMETEADGINWYQRA